MACRAAVVTEVGRDTDLVEEPSVGACVLTPAGVFFNRNLPYSPLVDGQQPRGGTWHWASECGPGPGIGFWCR
jgi:hypothetical protein